MIFKLSPLIVANLLTVAIILITVILKIKSKIRVDSREQSSPFECGFSPISRARIPFSIHYFLIAILFLIFDIEIIILIPAPITISTLPPSEWILPIVRFLIIVTLGWLHEWNEGSLDWSK